MAGLSAMDASLKAHNFRLFLDSGACGSTLEIYQDLQCVRVGSRTGDKASGLELLRRKEATFPAALSHSSSTHNGTPGNRKQRRWRQVAHAHGYPMGSDLAMGLRADWLSQLDSKPSLSNNPSLSQKGEDGDAAWKGAGPGTGVVKGGDRQEDGGALSYSAGLAESAADVARGRSREVPGIITQVPENLSPPERDSLRRKQLAAPRGAAWVLLVVGAGLFAAVCFVGHQKYGRQNLETAGAGTSTLGVGGAVQILGHFKVDEAPLSDLMAVESDGRVLLRTAAAEAFLRMQSAAAKDGVLLIPLSGFRSKAEQTEVFHQVKAARKQTAAQRAAVSAPAGYSEHHTGYALDIGDGRAVHSHLEEEFEATIAYLWLVDNAALFHFELSFPRDNKQGVMYEPWHWRFVGNDHSLETFFVQRAQHAKR